MSLTAVTIGIGNEYETYSKLACNEVTKYLNLETRIITADYLNLGIGETFEDKLASLKFLIFDIFPELDRVMYFDGDWKPLRSFNVEELCPVNDKAYFVTDRSDYWEVQNLERMYGFEPGTYVNAGWFIINKEHKHLLERCKQEYLIFPKSYYKEQDTFNYVFRNDMLLADKRLNVLDLPAMPYEHILGLHNKEENFKFYQNNE